MGGPRGEPEHAHPAAGRRPAAVTPGGHRPSDNGVNHMLASVFFRDSNYLEACLWSAIGVGFFVRAVTQRAQRGDTIIAAIAFVLFASSDVVEAQTGAWWRPWWLLA